jgi:outer membrane lipoprotein-sorting protein
VAGAVVDGRAAYAGDESDKASVAADKAKEILGKTAAALEKIRFARYEGNYKGIGWATEYVPRIEGSVALGEPSEYDIERFYCKVKLTPQKSEDTLELTAGSDGDIYFLVDQATKTVYADMDEAVLGPQSRNIQRILMRPFVAKEPLADDLKAEKVELMEPTVVAGEDCHQVRVTRSESQDVVWFVSKKDWLPRRVDRHYKNDKGEIGTTQLVLAKLTAETTFKPAPFQLKVPKGFTKTDEFAP